MTLAITTPEARLNRLRKILQEEITPRQFEETVAALISALLGLGIAIAKNGFQFGGDLGPGGRQGRRFRIETKRYSDSTSLSDRELLGEVDEALGRDPAVEAWFLAATRDVPEQLENALASKSDTLGLPILIIDWKKAEVPALAALCTAAPDILESQVSAEAAALARELKSDAQNAVETLKRDMETWSLGFERLRTKSLARLNDIWTKPRRSVAILGQDAAGGAQKTTIRRPRIQDAFDAWWKGRAVEDAPLAVIGREGVGKTWTVLQWLVERADDQPLVLVIPSSAVAGIGSVSNAALKRFIAERLYEMTEARDPQHWQLRFDRLLRRPSAEGPILTIVFDGMNQEPKAPWLDILKVLQDEEFEGRIRVIAITRALYFGEAPLSRMHGLVVQPEKVGIDLYDDAEGDEFDQRLAAEGLKRADLHEDLISVARAPRLFNLVVRLRKRLVDTGGVTVHRLLWEYGRDTLGVRGGKSFSEQEWWDWLAKVASQRLEGQRSYNLGSLGNMISRPDLDPTDVSRRLSEIVDGGHATTGGHGGSYELSATLVAHALGAALLDHLGNESAIQREEAEEKLTKWLDPIAGLDEKAEILRAAVSILLETGHDDPAGIGSVLVFAWLRSQNIPEKHRGELFNIASPLCVPLLDTLERSDDAALGSAKQLAVNALRAIRRDDDAAMAAIVERCRSWLCVISRDVDPPGQRHPDSEKARARRFMERVGADRDGELTVLGQSLTFVERRREGIESTIASLLEGFPLQNALPAFEAAALALAINERQAFRGWDGLKWLCLLNDLDFVETAAALRAKANELTTRTPEPGVHADLGRRAGALLLWLSGDEDNEADAAELSPAFMQGFDYDRDYLAKPATSIFSLEMRHVADVLANTELLVEQRARRAKPFFLDPSIIPSAKFCAELHSKFQSFDVGSLDGSRSLSPEDHLWEELTPALARCAPDLLASLLRAKISGLAKRPADKGYYGIVRSSSHYLLADEGTAGAVAELRALPTEQDSEDVGFADGALLVLETKSLPPAEQLARILDAGPKHIYIDLAEVLSPPSEPETDRLVAQYGQGTAKQQSQLLMLLSVVNPPLSEKAWHWVVGLAENPAFSHRGIAFEVLYHGDPTKFGELLRGKNWHWDPKQDMRCNHFGSLALASATHGLPFEPIAAAIAPWLALRAVEMRGGTPLDVGIAATILGTILGTAELEAPDPGADISVHDAARERYPLAFSVTARPEHPDDPAEQFRLVMNIDKQLEIRRRASQVAVERIKNAHQAGASLYLHNLLPSDFTSLIEHAPEAVASWLEGCDGPSSDFKRRVRLAEGVYLALCEALLAHSPQQGQRLWRALRASLTTRFMGRAGVAELIHMIFRVPAAPEALRSELLDIAVTNSDEELFDLTLAADINGQQAWLDRVIADDETSGVVWRRQRASKLKGYRAGNRLPIENAWPEGEAESKGVARHRDMVAWQRNEAFAHHWWDRYWQAETDDEAYAAWELFLRCADRRVHLWLRDIPACAGGEDRRQHRINHLWLNMDDLKRAMKKQEKDLDRDFLGRRIVAGIKPWHDSPDS